jgi:hypothetical protein
VSSRNLVISVKAVPANQAYASQAPDFAVPHAEDAGNPKLRSDLFSLDKREIFGGFS